MPTIDGSKENSKRLATFDIKVNGRAIPDGYKILSVLVEKKVNRIPMARIVIIDGEANTGRFDVSSSSTFVPGAAISIEAGYDLVNRQIFKGIVTIQSIRINDEVGSVLEVECRDEAIKMTVGRKCLTFSLKKDSDIISSIIGTYPGLEADVSATTTVWPEQVQYFVTDWDFILARAEVNGLIVTTINGKVSVVKPGADTDPVLSVMYGNDLYEFSADLNALTQLGSVQANAWDYKNQALTSGQASNNLDGPGNISSTELSKVIGLSSYRLQTTSPLETADLTNWSAAQLIKSEYSKIQGEIKIQGNNITDPGKYITIKGIGDRFSGDHLISGVTHSISDGNWFTELDIGLSPIWFTEEPDVMAPPASGQLPGAKGLLNGTVKKIFDDPDSQYRILVDVPMFDTNGAGIWARLSNFYSTSGAGAFFLPEVGDEVVLGFLNEDPRYPVILGSMYSSSKIKPYQGLDPNEKNQLKAIVSKSGIFIEFDDVDKVLTVSTPDKNTMIWSDKDKQISIKDENGNSMLMSQSGIDIKSLKNITIQSDQQISINGTQGITIQSSGGDVQITGVNIRETANVQYSAEGSATAQINGGGELTLKGGMVLIN